MKSTVQMGNLWFIGFMIRVINLGKNRRPECKINIDEHLNIDEASIQIERAHLSGVKNSSPPIIVKFLHYKDKKNVLKTYPLKRTRLPITIQMKKMYRRQFVSVSTFLSALLEWGPSCILGGRIRSTNDWWSRINIWQDNARPTHSRKRHRSRFSNYWLHTKLCDVTI